MLFERHAKGLFGSYFETNKDAFIAKKSWPDISVRSIRFYQQYSSYPKVFDIKTGTNKKFHMIRNMPMAKAVIKSLHDWEKR